MASPIKTQDKGVELPPGTYLFRLIEIQEGTQPHKKVSVINGKKVFEPTGTDVPALHFRFAAMTTAGEAKCRKTVPPFNGPTSGLVKLLHAMAPGQLTEEIRKDAEALWQFARSFVGRDFQVSTTSKDGWNNFANIMPIPQGFAPVIVAGNPAPSPQQYPPIPQVAAQQTPQYNPQQTFRAPPAGSMAPVPASAATRPQQPTYQQSAAQGAMSQPALPTISIPGIGVQAQPAQYDDRNPPPIDPDDIPF